MRRCNLLLWKATTNRWHQSTNWRWERQQKQVFFISKKATINRCTQPTGGCLQQSNAATIYRWWWKQKQQPAVTKVQLAIFIVFKKQQSQAAPTNWRRQCSKSKWWRPVVTKTETSIGGDQSSTNNIIFQSNNQPVAPTNQPAARKAAKASGGNNPSVVTKATRGGDSSTIKPWSQSSTESQRSNVNNIYYFLNATINRWQQPTGCDKDSKSKGWQQMRQQCIGGDKNSCQINLCIM